MMKCIIQSDYSRIPLLGLYLNYKIFWRYEYDKGNLE
jgi:hypothetical protein